MRLTSLLLFLSCLVSYLSYFQVSASSSSSSEESVSFVYDISHSLSSSWFPRGSVELAFSALRGGSQAKFQDTQVQDKKHIKNIVSLAESGSMYRVRFAKRGSSSVDDAIIATVPACSLLTSHFHELFLFHLDPYGHLLSVSYRVPVTANIQSNCQNEIAKYKSLDSLEFKPRAKVSLGKAGEKPKTPSHNFNMQQLNPDAATPNPATPNSNNNGNNPNGEAVKEEPKSFWAKYWMYIVPGVIFMLLQGAVAPPEEGGQQATGRPGGPQTRRG